MQVELQSSFTPTCASSLLPGPGGLRTPGYGGGGGGGGRGPRGPLTGLIHSPHPHSHSPSSPVAAARPQPISVNHGTQGRGAASGVGAARHVCMSLGESESLSRWAARFLTKCRGGYFLTGSDISSLRDKHVLQGKCLSGEDLNDFVCGTEPSRGICCSPSTQWGPHHPEPHKPRRRGFACCTFRLVELLPQVSSRWQ